jgi:hypothetical protein
MIFRGTLIGPASGKLNGVVASHNRGGQYFRTHTIPTDPNTTRQVNVRDAAKAAIGQWQANSPEERQGWTNWAVAHPRQNALGDYGVRSGWNEFCRWAIPRYNANYTLGLGLGIGNAVPTGDEARLRSLPECSLTAGRTIFRVSYDNTEGWCSDSDSALLLYLCSTRTTPGVRAIHAIRPTINWFRGPYQLAAGQPGDPDGVLSGKLDFTMPTTPDIGERVFYKIVLTMDDHGQSTPYTGVVIGAA